MIFNNVESPQGNICVKYVTKISEADGLVTQTILLILTSAYSSKKS